jgi:hypothetical protein
MDVKRTTYFDIFVTILLYIMVHLFTLDNIKKPLHNYTLKRVENDYINGPIEIFVGNKQGREKVFKQHSFFRGKIGR